MPDTLTGLLRGMACLCPSWAPPKCLRCQALTLAEELERGGPMIVNESKVERADPDDEPDWTPQQREEVEKEYGQWLLDKTAPARKIADLERQLAAAQAQVDEFRCRFNEMRRLNALTTDNQVRWIRKSEQLQERLRTFKKDFEGGKTVANHPGLAQDIDDLIAVTPTAALDAHDERVRWRTLESAAGDLGYIDLHPDGKKYVPYLQLWLRERAKGGG